MSTENFVGETVCFLSYSSSSFYYVAFSSYHICPAVIVFEGCLWKVSRRPCDSLGGQGLACLPTLLSSEWHVSAGARRSMIVAAKL